MIRTPLEVEHKNRLLAYRDNTGLPITRIHYVPKWIARRIRARFPCGQYAYNSWVFDRMPKFGLSWDHFGESQQGGRKCFVSEPYMKPENAIAQIPGWLELAEKLACDFAFQSRGFWNRGTVRFALIESDEPIDEIVHRLRKIRDAEQKRRFRCRHSRD